MKLRKEDFFYIPWILMVAHLCLANSSASALSTPIVSYFCIVMFIVKIVWTGHYSIRQIIIMSVLCAVAILATKESKDMRFLWFAIVICAAKKIDFEKTIKLSLVTTFICVISFVLMYLMGITEGVSYIAAKGTRVSWGLGHPNMCAAYYSLIAIYLIYLLYDKLKWKQVFLLGLGGIVVFYYTKSYSGLITLVFTLISFFVFKYVPFKKINTRIVVIILFTVIVLFTFIPIFYNNTFQLLDIAMNGRLHQANFYYSKYGIALLGNDVSFDLTNEFTDNILDIGYTRMLLYNGLIYYGIVVSGYIVSLLRSLEQQNRRLLILLGSMILYLAVENVASYIFMNASMVYFAHVFFGFERKRGQ